MKKQMIYLALLSQCLPATASEPEEVIVRASVLRQNAGELVTPATVVDRQTLQKRLSHNIGDALATTPGVNSSGFGPGVGRPVIRGHAAGRIRTLQGGSDTFDAATVSPDHAVSSDPFTAESIEVLRGPATLAHGSGAIGGVVNTVDNAIPEVADGRSVRLLTGVDNGKDGRFSAVQAHAGNGRWVGSVNAARSDANDIEIPGHAEANPEPGETAHATLDNSAADTESASAGIAFHGDNGFVGVAVERFDSLYGIPSDHDHGAGGEPVRVDMRQQRLRVRGERELDGDLIESIQFDAVASDYQHEELEGSEVGTRFDIDGRSLRLQARHAQIGRFGGVAGIHLRQRELQAAGEEAYLPPSESRAAAVYLVEELDVSEMLSLEFGTRIEAEKHDADNADSERFTLVSASFGLRSVIDAHWVFTGSVSHNQRAPTAEELFANGVHVATNSFDIGNPALNRETAQHVDLGLRGKGDDVEASITGFYTRFDDFIFADASDCNSDGVADRVEHDFDGACSSVIDPSTPGHDDEPLLTRRNQRDVDYSGAELSVAWRAWEGSNRELSVGAFADHVRARFLDGGAVPRIPATRVGASIDYTAGDVSTGLSWVHAFEVTDTARLETETDGYNRADAYLSWQLPGAASDWRLHLRGANLTDAEIRQHTSFVKDDVPEIGRHFSFAVEFELD